MTQSLKVDYLIVGAGAAGMAVCDELLTHTDANIAMVDRRHAPGGHWHDAYPFVRLHQPSAFYGVSSVPMGEDRIDETGSNAGFYELAGPDEIRAYYEQVMHRVFLPSNRVRYFPRCEYLEGHRCVSLTSGRTCEFSVGRKLVDTTYMEGSVPATSPPPFEVADDAWCVPAGEITRLQQSAERHVIIGAGKTALDTALWLLEHGLDPDRIRWIRPREGWWLNRKFQQPHALAPDSIRGMTAQFEALAASDGITDLFDRLESDGVFLRIDGSCAPRMFRGALASEREIEALRTIRDVVRLGHVRRIGRNEIELDEGRIPNHPRNVHNQCAARGLGHRPPKPIFEERRFTTQPFQWGFATYQSAMLAVVEATVPQVGEQNRLCRPMPYWDLPEDYLRAFRATVLGQQARRQHERLSAWEASTRLNPVSSLAALRDDPAVAALRDRIRAAAEPAMVNIGRLLSSV